MAAALLAGRMDPPAGTDVVAYQFYADADSWDDWKTNIPRDVTLHDRIQDLLELDAAFDGDADLAQLRLTEMKFERIRQRCQTALGALGDGDTEAVREELLTIRDVASVE